MNFKRETFVEKLDEVARASNPGPPILVCHPLIGDIGFNEGRMGFKSLIPSAHLNALIRDDERFSRERFEGVVKRARRRRKELGAISTWDGILNARGLSQFFDNSPSKASTTTTASGWSSLFRTFGMPGVGTYPANIPGGTKHDHTSVGAFPLIKQTVNSLYFTNFGWNAGTGTNIGMIADLLVSSANVLATVNTAQTITSPAYSRYGGTGEGVQMALDVTTALGTTASNVNISYTNQAGTSGQVTSAQAMTQSAIVQRLQPSTVATGAIFQTGDYGVRTVQTVTLSAAMTAGVMALTLFKPLMYIPSINTNAFPERSAASMVGGLIPLVNSSVGDGQNHACLELLFLPSAGNTGVVTMFYQTVWG